MTLKDLVDALEILGVPVDTPIRLNISLKEAELSSVSLDMSWTDGETNVVITLHGVE